LSAEKRTSVVRKRSGLVVESYYFRRYSYTTHLQRLWKAHRVVLGCTMIDWDDIRYFLAVSRGGSVRAAAKSLGVNHATVLRRISPSLRNASGR
jgi:Bacterial regulatory helix-turn-helix protein, lysR family